MVSGLALLKEIVSSCTDAERKIADHLLSNPKTAVFCTITELAHQAGSNPSAAIRLCKRAGLSGYRELQLLLTKDLYTELSLEDPPQTVELDSSLKVEEIARTVVEKSKDAIDRVLSLIKPAAMEAVAARILSARSVSIFGAGASANVAYDCFQKLTRIGIPCNFSFDSAIQMSIACGLTEADLVLVFSYSGRTSATNATAQEAKKSGATLVSITSVDSGPLGRFSDYVFLVPNTESLLRTGATLSRTSQLILVDILYATVVCRSLDTSMPRIERSLSALQLKTGYEESV